MDERPAWYNQVVEESQALVKAQPAGTLIEANQRRRTNEIALKSLLAEVPMLNRKYGMSAAEQWQGLYPETEQIIFLALQLGLTRAKAAALTGNSPKKFAQWMLMGGRGFEPFTRFSVSVMQIESLLEIQAIGMVEEAASLEMKTAGVYVKMLERRHPIVHEEAEKEDELRFDLFTGEELQEYIGSSGKKIPIRFQAGVIDGEEVGEDEIDPLEYRRVVDELKNLQEKMEGGNESTGECKGAVSQPGASGSLHQGAESSSVPSKGRRKRRVSVRAD